MKNKINILGSCVSRVSMIDGDTTLHKFADKRLEMGYYLDKQNFVCAMTPAPFPRAEVDAIKAEELWDKSRIHSLRQALNKDTVQLLLNSDAEWLVMDFYDFQNDFTIYGDTIFSSCAFEFYNTLLFRRYGEANFSRSNFCLLPPWIWYAYADLFFKQIMQKYDSNHIFWMLR